MKNKLVTFALLTGAGLGMPGGVYGMESPGETGQETAQEAIQEAIQEPMQEPVLVTAQTVELQTVRQELENARQAVEDARKVAEQIVLDAQREAGQIRQIAAVGQVPADLTPVEIRNRPVTVEIAAGTVEEIVTAIMPTGWRVMVDVKDQSLLQRRFQYVSTKSRDQALHDLLIPVGLKHQYFFDLKDVNGSASPLLVVSKR